MARRIKFRSSEQSRPILGLVGIVLTGLAIGVLAGWLWSGLGQEGVREEDYLILVSLLYERDRSVPNAQERLAALEDSDALKKISALAESYPKSHPEALAEARALRQLANALNISASGADDRATPERSGANGIWLWLGIALVLVCAIGIAGPLLLRAADSVRMPLSRFFATGPRRRDVLSTHRPMMRPTMSQGAFEALRRSITPSERAETPKSEVNYDALVADTPYTTLQFASHYEFGEDPYDEVHPITDPQSGTLIGACGLSAELKLSDDVPARYYAFSVWAHDYLSQGEFKSIGIVSKWMKSVAPMELASRVDAKFSDVVVANPGMRLLIDTANLAIDVHIAGFRYGTEAKLPSDAYFSSLTVNFEIKIKHTAPI